MTSVDQTELISTAGSFSSQQATGSCPICSSSVFPVGLLDRSLDGFMRDGKITRRMHAHLFGYLVQIVVIPNSRLGPFACGRMQVALGDPNPAEGLVKRQPHWRVSVS